MQWPEPSQESVASHAPPLDVPRQAVVAGSKESAGHAPDEPVQLSATSHWPTEGRHVVVAGLKPSLQVPKPSQESAASHAPPLDVPTQAVVAGSKESAGQSPDEPVQLSAPSHWPAEGRHVVVAGLKPSLQLPAPSQESVASHAPPLDVPTHVAARRSTELAGHAPDEPVQLSATSHWPAEGRH